MEHNSDFSHDLVVGKLGERVVDKMYEGDRVEVKSEQDQWKNTGNVFVESMVFLTLLSGMCLYNSCDWDGVEGLAAY